MKYFLIHGYGKGLDISEKEIPENGGFYIFNNEIQAREAFPYIWAESVERNWFTPYNLFAQLRLYFREQKKVQDPKVIQKLLTSLQELEPETIICHSTGATFLVELLKTHTLPTSIRTIIFVQADVSRKEFESIQIPNSIRFINFWCWWDVALISSIILNLSLPLGLWGRRVGHSVFYPLHTFPNPHQDVWKDKKFKETIKKEE